MVAVRETFLGRGIYTFSEAAKLTDVAARTVGAWFEGRFRLGQPTGRGPVLNRDYAGRLISFLDLIEVLVAGKLRQHGVRLPVIRRAHALMAERLDTSHPFSRSELMTDGRNIFIRTA